MQIIISCQHLDLSDGLQEHTEERVRKVCGLLDVLPAKCTVHLSVESHVHNAELLMHHQGHDFAAKATAEGDMYAAIDSAADRLRRQLSDFRSKRQNRR